MANFEFHAPPAIIYGKGSRSRAAECIKKLSITNLLIISDKYLDEIGIVAEIAGSVKSSGVSSAIYAGILNEPEISDVENALAAFKRNNCDGILGVGGGSAIDTAKAVSVMAANPGSIRDYMGYHKVKNAGVPLIAMPTTAGTGSEATRVTIITDTERDVKMMCLDGAFMPDAAIVDYELTMTMPKKLTAYVGLDALTHAIEAFVSAKANAASDMFALRTAELIAANILTAYNEPGNERARENMMLGANFAGIAFSNSSVCAVHGMSRPIGAYFHIAHGLSNAMLLPAVTERSIGGNISRYAALAGRLGCAGLDGDLGCTPGQAPGCAPGLPEGGLTGNLGCAPGLAEEAAEKEKARKAEEELAQKVVMKLKQLNNLLDIPSLKQYGVDKAAYYNLIPKMVDAAIKSGSPANNPKIFTPDEMADIYMKAYDYKIERMLK